MSHSIAQHSQTWRALLAAHSPPPPERGLERLWLAGMGLVERVRRRPAAYLSIASDAAAQRDEFRGRPDAELREHCERLRRVWVGRTPGRTARVETLAVIREQARRALGLEPFEVQMAGAAAILERGVIEMATGEGKTLVAALAAVVLGWKGRGCHIVTVNDYLVERDAEWMGALYRVCGVSVGFVKAGTPSDERRRAYLKDVTYATNKEVAADYLRDRVTVQSMGAPACVLFDAMRGAASSAGGGLIQRGLECAIVDEADSILIDEAVTPLILSGSAPNQEAVDAAREGAALAESLTEGEHYGVDREFQEVRLLPRSRDALLERAGAQGGLWKGRRRAEELIIQALAAREVYKQGRQYVVKDGRVVIVDEFTGRLMPDRTWRGGLHQAIEAKERLEVQPMKDTLARISFQRFFRSYRVLAGMTGTAREARAELWSRYRLPVVPIPTNRPCVRRAAPACIVRRADDRWAALLEEIEAVHQSGRPVLVGTRTVEASERLSVGLASRGIAHSLLNAVRHDQEAAIIAGAGGRGAVTIATNMAGRGTDIRLAEGVAELGGLHVVVTEPHESSRIDRQFFGRAARQGDPGSVRLFASLDDEVFLRSAPRLARLARAAALPRAAMGLLLRVAQRRAQSIAGRRRDAVMRADDWLEKGLGFAGAGRV